ncbi:alpha-amylase family protein [Actinopolymorpha alba]|uniref:alpha-amylase family protein n=1 Tax=Actinopolymorpha alba TaxID=533267 RepID=UPI0003645B3A|nr:alpha-amylase family protein [Actinopolymorpha alba]
MTEATKWWGKPYRTFQTNLREIDASLDVEKVLDHIQDIGANTWLLNTAGIVSFFPSELPFQHPSPWLAERPSGDLIGDAVTAAHERGVRVISRVDFSKVHRDVAEAHPDWCFVGTSGEHQIYNGLYSTCPSGPYYQERSQEILAEVLDRYPVDGFFFNWFGFNERDYSGRYHGICQCTHCRRRFQETYGVPLPRTADWEDPAYIQWRGYTRMVLDDLARRIREFLRGRRPDVALILSADPDVVFYEANNAIERPQPLWVQGVGEFVRESRTARPDKPVWVNTVMFLDLPYRFTVEQAGYLGLHLSQTLAHGGNPSAYMIGTPELFRQRSFDIVTDVFTFHREHQRFYEGLRSAARIALVSSTRSEEVYGGAAGLTAVRNERRGIHRALVEGHLPFDIIPDAKLCDLAESGRLGDYDALILPNVAILDDRQLDVLDAYVDNGGGLLATFDTGGFDSDGRPRTDLGLRSLGATRILARREGDHAMRSAYLRADEVPFAPGNTLLDNASVLTDSPVIMLDPAFLHVEATPDAETSLPLVPPSRYGPPEKCYWDIETEHPGLLLRRFGKGRTAYIPWPVGSLYYDLSLPDHRWLLTNALHAVLPSGPQLTTNAPPQVEIVVGRQDDSERTLLHLINYSGHQGRAFHAPLEIRDVKVSLPGVRWRKARSLRLGEELPTASGSDGAIEFTLPRLGLFDLVVLE